MRKPVTVLYKGAYMKDQFEKSSWAQQGEDLIVDFLFSCYIKKQKVKNGVTFKETFKRKFHI